MINRSHSHNLLTTSQISKSPSKRTIYLNQETDKREVNTPFHSPYKDGRPNPNYFNPSFVSSHLFYPKQYTVKTNNSFNIASNRIPTTNDIKKEQLYRKRLNTQQASHSKTREKGKQREFVPKEMNKYRILRSNEPQTLLKKDLDNLLNYRENMQLKKERIQEISRKRWDEPEEPIYMEKARRTQLATFSPKKTAQVSLQEYQAMNQELAYLRKQLKQRSDDRLYADNLNRLIEKNNQLIISESAQQRKQRELLSSVLKEQIRANKVLKEKRWNY